MYIYIYMCVYIKMNNVYNTAYPNRRWFVPMFTRHIFCRDVKSIGCTQLWARSSWRSFSVRNLCPKTTWSYIIDTRTGHRQ